MFTVAFWPEGTQLKGASSRGSSIEKRACACGRLRAAHRLWRASDRAHLPNHVHAARGKATHDGRTCCSLLQRHRPCLAIAAASHLRWHIFRFVVVGEIVTALCRADERSTQARLPLHDVRSDRLSIDTESMSSMGAFGHGPLRRRSARAGAPTSVFSARSPAPHGAVVVVG